MNGTTMLIWMNIAIIGIIAIIVVKLYFNRQKEKNGENAEILDNVELKDKISGLTDKISGSTSNLSNKNPSSNSLNSSNKPASLRKEGTTPEEYSVYIVPEVEENNNINANNIEYESPNQVIVNYGNEVKKFQEPIKQSQMDIMTQRSNKHELKDLFTIDELIKESKRKDDEREKESKKINKDAEDLTEIKESIKMRKENKDYEDELIEEIKDTKEESIADIIKEDEEKSVDEEKPEISSASQKDVDEAIESATKESEEPEIEDISEKESITDALLESEEEIKTPALKTPTKIEDGVSILSGEDNDYKFGGQLEDSELFNDDENDLDYRKDIAKVTNKLKQSKLLQDVKEKLTQDPVETQQDDTLNESYIRNVNEYEEYEPIINETHRDFDADYEAYHNEDFDQMLREQNTKKIFKSQPAPETETVETEIPPIKSKPSRDNIKIQLNNNEVVLKKGDEIIFKHDGETYSSQVFAINGDDISVKYRRKKIIIKPEDVKKIY